MGKQGRVPYGSPGYSHWVRESLEIPIPVLCKWWRLVLLNLYLDHNLNIYNVTCKFYYMFSIGEKIVFHKMQLVFSLISERIVLN